MMKLSLISEKLNRDGKRIFERTKKSLTKEVVRNLNTGEILRRWAWDKRKFAGKNFQENLNALTKEVTKNA